MEGEVRGVEGEVEVVKGEVEGEVRGWRGKW